MRGLLKTSLSGQALFLISLAGLFLLIPKTAFAIRSSTLTTTAVEDLTPNYVKASSLKVPIFTFTLTNTQAEAFTQVKVKYTGTNSSNVSTVYLYGENTSPGYGGTFSSTIDSQITSTSTSSSGIFTLDFSSFTFSPNTPKQFYIVVDIASNPTHGNIIDLKIELDGLTVGGNTWPDSEIDPAGSSVADTRTPQSNARETQDLDNDGYIDALKLTFMDSNGNNDPILDSSVNINNFNLSLVSGVSFSATTNGDTANDHVIYLTFTDGVYKTDIKPTLTYTAGTLSDNAGNLVASFGPYITTDKAPPIAQTAATADVDSDGFIDKLTITFSEDLNGTTVGSSGNDFSVSGYTVSSADETSAGIVNVILTEKTSTDTNQTPQVTVAGNGSSIGVKDLNNNWTNSHSLTPLDGAAPINPTLSFSSSTTNSTSPSISISNDTVDVSYWLVSETQNTQPSSGNSNWVSSRPSTVTLTSTEGTKTVYLWVKDNSNNINAGTVSSTITLITTLPSTPLISLKSLTGDSTYTRSDTVNVSIINDSGGNYWFLSEDSSTPSVNSSSWSTSRPTSYNFAEGADGTKTLYIWTKDNNGNISSRASASITLDKTAPTGSVSINSGDIKTTSTEVLLNLSATDPTSGVSMMRFSNDGVSFTGFEAYKSIKSWSLISGEGNKTVYATFIDNVGNTITYSSNITLENEKSASENKQEAIPSADPNKKIPAKVEETKEKESEISQLVTPGREEEEQVLGIREEKPVIVGEVSDQTAENKLIWIWAFAGAAFFATGILSLTFNKFKH